MQVPECGDRLVDLTAALGKSGAGEDGEADDACALGQCPVELCPRQGVEGSVPQR